MDRSVLTPKQEAFAQAYVETGNACEAYRRAYDAENMKQTSIEVAASRLLNNAKVTLRIQGLREALAAHHAITKERVLYEAVSVYERAHAKGEHLAAIRSLRFIAELQGFLKKRVEVKKQRQPIELTIEEAREILALARAGAMALPVVEGDYREES